MADWRSSAAYRIAFTYSAAFALAMLLLGAAVYFAADAAFRSQQDASIAEESASLLTGFRQEGWDELRETVLARETGKPTRAFGYALFDGRGHRSAGELDVGPPAKGWRDIVFRDPDEGPDPARALVTDLGQGRKLVVALDTESLEQIDRTILVLFGAGFVVVLVLGLGGALVLGSYLRNRLNRINDTAQAIAGGDLNRRVPVGRRQDEFDRLAQTLNAMLDRMAVLMENLRQVSSDVAHDLRTPLAGLLGEIETAMTGPPDAMRDRAALKRVQEKSQQLLALFASILRISEVEGGAVAKSFAPVDMSALLTDLCETYAPAVADGGRSLTCALAPGLVVRGDRELLAQAMINLLDNAQQHTPVRTRISVDAAADVNGVRFSVADDGPGVAERDRERITRRFVRLENSRSGIGHGLGLNLVAAIVAAHKGRLMIDDNAPGLSVAILLPDPGGTVGAALPAGRNRDPSGGEGSAA